MFGVLAGLAAGAAAFLVLRRLGYDLWITATAVLLCLFVPASQFSHVMVGNEALAAGFVAAALVFVLRLQQTPGDAVAGGLAGLLVGLALATKYTSALAIAACAVPVAAAWLRERRLASDVVRAGLRALAARN